MVEYTKSAVNGVGYIIGTGASSVYSYLRSFVGPKSERVISEDTVGMSEKDISKVIEQYQMVQTRFKANDILLSLESEYREQLKDTLTKMGALNSNDSYVKDWIDYLTHRQLEIQDKISMLQQNQELYTHYKNDATIASLKAKVNSSAQSAQCDDDEFWLCKICEENRKNRALDCGHVFCGICIEKLRKCPLCKIEIDRTKVRSVYL